MRGTQRSLINTMSRENPSAFEFEWRAKAGPLIEAGRGLLSRNLHRQKELLDEFLVLAGDLIVTVKPKCAEILLDGHRVFKCDCAAPHELVWYRTMQKQLGGDANSEGFRCVCYGLGLKCKQMRFGFQFFEDGRIEQGIS